MAVAAACSHRAARDSIQREFMNALVRRIDLQDSRNESHERLRREWLLTNGLGGYASGTISGSVTRRYHGLLIAALPAPLGRIMMLNHIAEDVRFPDGRRVQFGGEEPSRPEETPESSSGMFITEFRLEWQLPIWRYDIEGIVIEKRVLLVHGQNTVHITYQLLSGQEAVRLELRPSFQFRPHENDVAEPWRDAYRLVIHGPRYEVHSEAAYPPLRLSLKGEAAAFTHEGGHAREIAYAAEAERGYRSRGVLWSPGTFAMTLRPKRNATFSASTESWETLLTLTPPQAHKYEEQRRKRLISLAHPSARDGAAAELVLAADQFLISPTGRVEDVARARAAGDEVRSVIAGYHWFTDWGRDTMISLEGLTLTTGRPVEAGWVLRTFAHYVRDGVIPTFFPDGQNEGVYHTADATLWFFHALDRYLERTKDRGTLQLILPKLLDIVDFHLRGTRFHIGVDPADGLLRQGAEGYQLTWMDAKVDDWVVTPRRGKAVEINALWYNALRLLEHWCREEGVARAGEIKSHADRARAAFNQRFWCAEKGYLYDVVDGESGDDAACRPNQVFSMSLHYPVLAEAHWDAVLEVVRDRLLTPVGLRSLSRDHPDYKARYFGDLRARDAAYHQGTVWAWLIGPFIDAWLKRHPADGARARGWLAQLVTHLDTACVGSISEIFDAEPPFTPRGCVAQAWSVAEALRCWVKTAPQSGHSPADVSDANERVHVRAI
jgi:predicted glycogen debranching enzyme